MTILLHDFFRSSSCYRVRIALALKGLPFERAVVNFREDAQRSAEYLRLNPHGLVPALEIDGKVLTQSLAIIDYLDATRDGPKLIPSDPGDRADILSLSLAIACDIHPVDNLRVLARLREQHGADEARINDWYRHWVGLGLSALEAQLKPRGIDRFVAGEPGLFEICLVPQIYNARRYEVDMSLYPTLSAIDAAACALPEFAAAAPERFAPAG